MATGMHMDKRSVDCLVLGHHDQDRNVSAKSVTMRGTTFYVVTEKCSYIIIHYLHVNDLPYMILARTFDAWFEKVYVKSLQTR